MRHGVAVTDLGERIFCRVIGSNVYGADTAYTSVVGPVLDAEGLGAPVNAGGVDAPDVTGSPNVSEELHCDPGFWIGSAPITYFYQWYQVGGGEPPPEGETLTADGDPLTADGEELVT